MSHSHINIWIHAIWATKNKLPLITPAIEASFFSQMTEGLKGCGCHVKIINLMPDYVHSLFSINAQKSVGDIVKRVKGVASYWINQQNDLMEKFAWQKGYAAYSASESQLQKVFEYVKNQQVHHEKITFQQEYDDFIRLHKLENKGR